MQRQQSDTQTEEQKSRKNRYDFNLDRGRKILIQSDFDNGNINLIRQVTQLQYRLEAVSDGKTTSPKKTWFHFRVSAPKNIRVRLIIENISIYENMYQDKDWAKPVMNDGSGWKQVKDCFLTYRGEIGIIIDYTFTSQIFVYFAMAVPHTYEESQNYLKQLAFKIPDYIHYQDQILCKSYGRLNLHLLRFTLKQQKNKQGNNSSGNIHNDYLNINDFANDKKNNVRVHSQANIDKCIINSGNQIKKPIILITSRVHPGEVGSSHCLMGMIQFLLRAQSLQSYLILKMFQILIIPVVNPDGVYEGNYRMDLNNCNLNRVYQQPSQQMHPTVYRIKEYISNLLNPNIGNPIWPKQKNDKLISMMSRKIMFHFDLHSHSCIKSAFIYGNAFDQIVAQTQSELFCKLLQQNSPDFKYSLSHFGQKHMKMKDKGEALTKEGCARVVMSKMANIIYSYTIQTAIFPYLNKQQIAPVSNRQFKIADTFLKDQTLGYNQVSYQQLKTKYGIKNQSVLDNMMLGYSIMTTVLDILQKNPYSRICTTGSNIAQNQLDIFRKEISQGLLQNEQRFKLLDIKAHQKVRNIIRFCRQQIISKNQKHWDYLSSDKLFKNIKWPLCFKMFENVNNNVDSQISRRKNRIKTDISESQRQVNDFLNPKNVRKRLLNLQVNTETIQEPKLSQNIPSSPTKSAISPRRIQIQLQLKPSDALVGGQTHILPQIRRSIQRTKNRATISSSQHSNKERTESQNIDNLRQIKEMKQLKQLNQKQSTKNIVLSFIHEQMQKMNTIRKNVQKSMAVQNRLASYKLIKKSTKSSKALNALDHASLSSNRQTGISSLNLNSNNQISSGNYQIPKMLTRNKSQKKKLHHMQTCEQVIRRRNHPDTHQQLDEDQQQYQQQEGVYYVDKNIHNLDQQQLQIIQSRRRYTQQRKNQLPIKPRNQKMPTSLQKISQYPVYPMQKQKDNTIVAMSHKRELAKMKYSEIKKKNIIRQDLNSSIKLPQLRGVGSNQAKNTVDQKFKNDKNGLSINVNLNVNLNLHIESGLREITSRARAATMPDEV